MNDQPWLAVLTTDRAITASIHASVAQAGTLMETAPDAATLRQAIDGWPVLILVDLTVPGWEAPVRWAKTHPHTRTIPIVAFNREVDREAARLAQAAGCDQIWLLAELLPALPGLLAAELQPPTRWLAGWDEPPPPALCRGVEQFNAGEYWECHETLEQLWMAERRPIRDLYQGILQVGVGFHHLQQRNYAGAIKMFRRGLPRLRGLPEVSQGVSVAGLSAAARAVHDAAVTLGPERISQLDLAALPKISVIGCR